MNRNKNNAANCDTLCGSTSVEGIPQLIIGSAQPDDIAKQWM